MKLVIVLVALFAIVYADVSELPAKKYLPASEQAGAKAESGVSNEGPGSEQQGHDAVTIESAANLNQGPQATSQDEALGQGGQARNEEPKPAHTFGEDGYRYKQPTF
ncbi:unnamed protein product [Hermetia illucens]|uniref:Uncharacterized protein n=1 Tax=Hermetia illucens TaxID=343691 RepID=A0A7R8UJ67_HERIL|nr:uncharacterized protein LOC119649394 [Hermetia illucens]CAD7081638.1 unnamed protein product [Hermetia illucens]